MKKHHIAMLLSNAYRPDPRVAREARCLAENDYKVSIICWDRQAELPEHEMAGNIEIIRVQSVRSVYGSGWRQLFYLPRFWKATQGLVKIRKPLVVHCHDLDTLYAGVQLKKKSGCKLVYDAHEHYPALMSLYLPQIMVRLLVGWERWLMKSVDATITASTVLRDEFVAKGYSSVLAAGNFQDLAPYAAVTQDQVRQFRAELQVSPDELLVAYIGGFSRNRLLLPLLEAASLLPDVKFHIWGDGHQRDRVEGAANRRANVVYHGWLSPRDLPKTFKAADVIYYCLLREYPGAVYNAPNTLSQAMAASRPIIANRVGDLGRIIQQAGCGILLDTVTPQTVASAIRELGNPEMRERLGGRGWHAANTTYNVQVVQKELLELYRHLLKRNQVIAG